MIDPFIEIEGYGECSWDPWEKKAVTRDDHYLVLKPSQIALLTTWPYADEYYRIELTNGETYYITHDQMLLLIEFIKPINLKEEVSK